MHQPSSNASSQPDLEIIIPKNQPRQLFRQSWQDFNGFSRHRQIQILTIASLGLVFTTVATALTFIADHNLSTTIAQNSTVSDPDSATSDITAAEQPDASPNPVTKPQFIDLQSVVNRWSSGVKAKVGLIIYDLDNNRIAAELNPNQTFSTASIYKLFFAYVGYQDIDTGYIDPDQPFAITNDYRADTYTFSECLDLMIRESYNGCADPVRSNQRLYRRAENLIEELKLAHTTDGGLYSTPTDMTTFLKFLYENHDLSVESWSSFQDSMLNQPPTKVSENDTYDWRQGLPAGFSNSVTVYDKVGWAWSTSGNYWTTYNDAAIVEFPDLDRHYTIVLFTTDLHEDPPISLQKLGAELESAIRAGSKDTN